MRKKALVGLALVLVLALIGPIGSASAATHKVALTYKVVNGGPQPVNHGTWSGSPFGSGKFTQREVQPGSYYMTLEAKSGSVTMYMQGAPSGGKIKGTWKLVNGTGKFKGVKGTGALVGTGTVYNLTGSATY